MPRLRPLAATLAVVLAASLTTIALTAPAGAAVPQRIITPLAASTMAPPIPVQGSDGRWHVAYEVHVENWTDQPVTLQSVQVVAGGSGRVLARFEGAPAIAGLLNTAQFATPDPATATLAPGQATILWITFDVARRALVPAELVHRVQVLIAGPGGATDTVVMDVARTRVSARTAAVLGRPLRGSGYVDANGCCAVAPHTRAIQTVDGRRWLSQRFAIDWIKVDAQGRSHAGDPHDPASYFVYGQPVLAAARGRVVSVLDGRKDQSPPTPDTTLTRRNAADYVTGNHVIVDIGHGRFATYAHLQPHKIRVREGQRVRKGQVLGLVGNSGNSSEPHLHFHVGDRPSPLEADGLPYTYERFRVTAQVGDLEAFVSGADGVSGVAALVPTVGPTLRVDALPLMDDVVDFGR